MRQLKGASRAVEALQIAIANNEWEEQWNIRAGRLRYWRANRARIRDL